MNETILVCFVCLAFDRFRLWFVKNHDLWRKDFHLFLLVDLLARAYVIISS